MFDSQPFTWKSAWRETVEDLKAIDRRRTWGRLGLVIVLVFVVNELIQLTAR